MKLYIVRHGETDYNQKKILQGKKDIPLNQTGIYQALEMKEKLKNISFDIVMSSPLKRALETASLIAPDQIIKIDSRLSERNLGSYEGKSIENYMDHKAKYQNYFENCTLESVEGIQDLMKRVQEIIKELKQAYENKTILLVTHAGWINAFVHTLEPIPENGDLEWFEFSNVEFLEYNI